MQVTILLTGIVTVFVSCLGVLTYIAFNLF